VAAPAAKPLDASKPADVPKAKEEKDPKKAQVTSLDEPQADEKTQTCQSGG